MQKCQYVPLLIWDPVSLFKELIKQIIVSKISVQLCDSSSSIFWEYHSTTIVGVASVLEPGVLWSHNTEDSKVFILLSLSYVKSGIQKLKTENAIAQVLKLQIRVISWIFKLHAYIINILFQVSRNALLEGNFSMWIK